MWCSALWLLQVWANGNTTALFHIYLSTNFKNILVFLLHRPPRFMKRPSFQLWNVTLASLHSNPTLYTSLRSKETKQNPKDSATNKPYATVLEVSWQVFFFQACLKVKGPSETPSNSLNSNISPKSACGCWLLIKDDGLYTLAHTLSFGFYF